MFSPVRLATLRSRRGMSRSDLHRALVRGGLSICRSLVDRWEQGRSEPGASEVALLAHVLGVPLDELFDPPTAPLAA